MRNPETVALISKVLEEFDPHSVIDEDCKTTRDDDDCLKVDRPRVYHDDITGQTLDPTLVEQARQKELDYFESKQVWEVVSISKALKDT